MVIGRVFDFNGGIPGPMEGCFYYAKERIVLPLAALVGLNIEKLQQMTPHRVHLKDHLVEFIGPLTLSLPLSTRMQYTLKIVAALFAFYLCGGLCYEFLVDPETADESPFSYRLAQVNSLWIGLYAASGAFHFLEKTKWCQARVELFPPGATFVKGWLDTVKVSFTKGK
jgi:hypothetical protein